MSKGKWLISRTRKAEILKVAAKLFWDIGYDKTTLKQIAEACGFEAPNIYNYYKSKDNSYNPQNCFSFLFHKFYKFYAIL